MKLALFAILGLLLGTGGGAAMAVMNAKKAFAAYDAKRAKVVADSIELGARHAAGPDSTHGATPDSSHAAPDSVHGPAAVATTDAHAPATAAPTPGAPKAGEDKHAPAATKEHTPATGTGRQRAVATVESHGGTAPRGKPAPPLPAPRAASITPAPGSDKMGKIFGAMPAKDAAKVLEQLTDAEVHDILRVLSDKQAAGIMQFLPPARAASISKLALKGGHE
jgi:MgtE intracellular N domain